MLPYLRRCFLLFFVFVISFSPVFATELSKISGCESNFELEKSNVVRTSTGQLYDFFLNENEVRVLSLNAEGIWTSTNDLPLSTYANELSVAIDSQDIVHIIMAADEGDGSVYYSQFNTIDSPLGNNSWIDIERVNDPGSSEGEALVYLVGMAIDANDIPHIAFLTHREGSYAILRYQNRSGGNWNNSTYTWNINNSDCVYAFARYSSIAVGDPADRPYIYIGSPDYQCDGQDSEISYMFRGNANIPTSFSQQTLPHKGWSFVIQQNGDMRVAVHHFDQEEEFWTYANYVHDATESWSSGWSLEDSGQLISSNFENNIYHLTLAGDEPIAVVTSEDYSNEFRRNIFVKRGLHGLVETIQPPLGYGLFEQRNPRVWSFHNQNSPELIDIASSSSSKWCYPRKVDTSNCLCCCSNSCGLT